MQADGQILRRLLADSEEPLLVAGVHDALSAMVAEQAGFKAVWASSFGLSAVAGLPDLNLLSMTEVLTAMRQIRGAINIPVIADCDSGYGNELNAYRMGREFHRSLLTVICIEDNPFPKRCSLYDGDRRLEPLEHHASRIRALREGATEEAFIIARTEALTAGATIREALERANAYVEAGADAILVQTKSKDGADVIGFAESWERKDVPLIAVPTTYNVRFADLFHYGFRVIIMANQLLRASVGVMQGIAEDIYNSESSGDVREKISSLENVYALLQVKAMDERQRRFQYPLLETVR